jgi:hypothetical protein
MFSTILRKESNSEIEGDRFQKTHVYFFVQDNTILMSSSQRLHVQSGAKEHAYFHFLGKKSGFEI